MLLFNIFLRPTLMIFGLIAGLLLSSVVVKMINYAFWDIAVTGIYGMSGTSGKAVYTNPLAAVLFLAAYIMLIVIALNKSFSAIHVIPEQVMRWIGGQGEKYGEGDAVGEMKQAVTGAASGAKGAASEARGQGEKGGSAYDSGISKEEGGSAPDRSKAEQEARKARMSAKLTKKE